MLLTSLLCFSWLATHGEGASRASHHFRFFSPSSVWNRPLADDAALDPNSREIVRTFEAEVRSEQRAGIGPWINTVSYSVPIYTVPADQPPVAVTLRRHPASTLQGALDAVPLPPDAQPASGSDGTLVVWQPSTDRLWELWRLRHEAEGWRASWGGAMTDASANRGVYGPEAWPGSTRWWGSSASSMSIAGGLITFADLTHGHINHALSISTPDVRRGVYASPARRTDGESTNPFSLPEGGHLRLNPKLDLAALHLPHMTLMIAEAAQRYGIFVRDRAPAVTAFYAQDPISTGSNPYLGPNGYFEGKFPRQLLRTFPWHHLQLLKMKLHVIHRSPR